MKGTALIFLVCLLNVVNSRIHVNVNPLNDGRDLDRSPKVTWVKRILPHGYKSAPYDYDSKLQTLFVPKYRVQKRIDVNTKPELASKVFQQPLKAYQTGRNEEEVNDLLKGLLNAANDDRKTNYYITSTKFDEKKNIKPTDFNTVKVQKIDYEKPWQQEELKSVRPHKIKQEPYFDHFDSLLKTTHNSNNERKINPKAKYSVYSDGRVWQTLQKNPRVQKKIISYTRDELLKKYQNAEFEKPRHNGRYSKNTQMNSAELVVPYTMVKLKHEKKTYKNDLHNILNVINNLIRTKQREGSESLTENIEHNPDKKPIVEAVKYVDAVIDGLDKDEDKTKLNNKTKLMLFKSMDTYHLNKHNILNNKRLSRLKRVLSDVNNVNEQGNTNPDSPWGSLKPPIDSDLTETDVLNELLHAQEPKPNGVNSDVLWESVHPNIKRTQLSNLENLLERLRGLVDYGQQSEESDDSSTADSYWTPIEPTKKQRSTKLEDLHKTLAGYKQSLSSDSDSTISDEPEWPAEVIQKHKVQLILPPLSKNEPTKVKSYVNPNNEKVHFYIRNLGDLLKIMNYMKKVRKDPQLRDRPTNSVILELEQSHKQRPFNIPHYSIWNYWTYDKNLFHDNCPGEQAQVGNKCIWTPPHRK